MSKQIAQDAKLIESLGGAAKVADLLGFDKTGGVQRVHNWISRGIPAHVKVEHPHIFMSGFKPSKRKAAA